MQERKTCFQSTYRTEADDGGGGAGEEVSKRRGSREMKEKARM